MKRKKIEIDITKSGHPKMLNPIMLYFKAKGIHTAPPGNSYSFYKYTEYKKLSMEDLWKLNYYLYYHLS